jgi:hypothetical protein
MIGMFRFFFFQYAVAAICVVPLQRIRKMVCISICLSEYTTGKYNEPLIHLYSPDKKTKHYVFNYWDFVLYS